MKLQNKVIIITGASKGLGVSMAETCSREGAKVVLAEAYCVSIAPHNPQGPVSTAASLEFGFATPSYLICESVKNDVPWRDDIVRSGFTIEPKGQIVRPSGKPGLGIEINEDEVRKHPFEQEILRRSFTPDGAVTDW